jgi:hypothetical protein
MTMEVLSRGQGSFFFLLLFFHSSSLLFPPFIATRRHICDAIGT